jgi:hypothetical protein
VDKILDNQCEGSTVSSSREDFKMEKDDRAIWEPQKKSEKR